MSVLYSILKPIIRKAVKENLHQESYEEFVQVSHRLQIKFKFRLPQKKGYEFRDEIIDGCHCIVGHKSGSGTKRALLYLVGGANRRYQLPKVNTMVRYMNEADRDLWIPLYPLYPDNDLLDEVEMVCHTYSRMLQDYKANDIAWLGFSSGADNLLASGRHIIKNGRELSMPGLIIAVSCNNILISEESFERMKEIEKRDIMMSADSVKAWSDYYNHDGTLPSYLLGCAATDDYTGFPKIIMYFGGDEIFAAEAPDYEKAFDRCGVNDYTIHVEPGLFHSYPFFTFLKEGKQGENEIIEHLKALGEI
ncbi:MAG: alpha/beta hydrolase fold domain-containing protein [Oscillospiraceae bacterium]|nr:alpha/beta hydrolase fold domain-containing protein [Oscillospiraceae bacterium]